MLLDHRITRLRHDGFETGGRHAHGEFDDVG